MRILITGAGGFVGEHLARSLLQATPEAELHGTTLNPIPDRPSITFHVLDLKDEKAVQHLLDKIHPDHIYHLAAQASPRRSFEVPWETLENNIHAQLNIIQSCLSLRLQARILVVSSAEIYGPTRPEQQPIKEDAPFKPTNPYGVSKVTQDMLGLQYFLSHKLPILRARPFNHIGPGQSEGFVATDFASQIARIEAGKKAPVIEVGNLGAQRDFTDVRDVVRAYRLIMEKGTAGEVYNIASGMAYSIQKVLDILLSYSTVPIDVRVDQTRMMPIDVPIIQGDASRLRQSTGWQPSIPFEQSLLDVLNDWRTRIQQK
ncbi:MAG: GDP-mannose 4,6-dehydratase [Anaerolineae bacterium]|nr:GDP-mannose 4,6-dehydratase [Anaerolineae bacterium]